MKVSSRGKNGINPFSWIKGGNRLTRFAHKKINLHKATWSWGRRISAISSSRSLPIVTNKNLSRMELYCLTPSIVGTVPPHGAKTNRSRKTHGHRPERSATLSLAFDVP